MSRVNSARNQQDYIVRINPITGEELHYHRGGSGQPYQQVSYILPGIFLQLGQSKENLIFLKKIDSVIIDSIIMDVKDRTRVFFDLKLNF